MLIHQNDIGSPKQRLQPPSQTSRVKEKVIKICIISISKLKCLTKYLQFLFLQWGGDFFRAEGSVRLLLWSVLLSFTWYDKEENVFESWIPKRVSEVGLLARLECVAGCYGISQEDAEMLELTSSLVGADWLTAATTMMTILTTSSVDGLLNELWYIFDANCCN